MRYQLLLLIIFFITSTSGRGGTFTTVSDGQWTDDGIWNSAPADNDCNPTANHTYNIEDSVYINCAGSIEFAGRVTINVRSGGVLYIDTDGGVSGNVTINVDAGGKVVVTGDLDIGSSSSITNNGEIEVQGIATASGGGYSFDCDGSGGGTVNFANGSCAICTNGSSTCVESPLPVKYGQFDVSLHEDGVELYWTTVSEENNDYFIIERSYNGTDWEEIERLDGAGNSSDVNIYLYVDASPFRGINYYRIIQVDFDGQQSVSEIKQIQVDHNEEFDMIIYPNPSRAGEPVHLKFIGVYAGHILELSIFDLSGKIVHTEVQEIEEYHGIHVGWDLEHELDAGTYIIKVLNGQEVTNHKLIIQ